MNPRRKLNSMDGGIFFVLLTQPMYNLLIAFYNGLAAMGIMDLGLAIIAVTIVLKLVLLPFTAKSVVAQRDMQALQPEMDALKKKHKDNKEAQAKAMMELYKTHKINPMSSCLPILVQLPILIALYNVLQKSVTHPEALAMLYAFVPAPEVINTTLFSIVDLGARSIPLAVIAGAVQYVQAKMLQVRKPPSHVGASEGSRDESMAAAMSKSMVYTMPLMTVIFGATLPGGVTLYWLVSGVVSVLQQVVLFRAPKPEVTA